MAYHNAHPYARGVSGVLTAAALAGAALAFAVVGLILILERRRSEIERLESRVLKLEVWHRATILHADRRDAWHWRALDDEERAVQAEARAQEAWARRERQEDERKQKQTAALAAETAAYKRRQERLAKTYSRDIEPTRHEHADSGSAHIASSTLTRRRPASAF